MDFEKRLKMQAGKKEKSMGNLIVVAAVVLLVVFIIRVLRNEHK